MDGADPGRWSSVAADWAELWGGLAAPWWQLLTDMASVGPGRTVLDVGCGSGDLLAHMRARGARTAGLDPAQAMVEAARARLPGADIRVGVADRLPWDDDSFDLATSVNALHFADDPDAALRELARVTVTGGLVAVANWAAADRNDLDTIEHALAVAAGQDPTPGGDLREPGGLEAFFTDAALEVVAAGEIEIPWEAPDDDTLLRGVLLGETPSALAEQAPVVLAAARPFRLSTGGYRLGNAFRYAIGRARQGTEEVVP